VTSDGNAQASPTPYDNVVPAPTPVLVASAGSAAKAGLALLGGIASALLLIA
jgi:hypothetical protein